MPIGKSSINRVTNNGYSNVKTKAPDMENSTVIANPSPQVVEKLLPKTEAKKETAAKKPAAKTGAAKTGAAKTGAAKTTTAKATATAKKPTAAKPTAAKPAAKKPAQTKPAAPAVKKEEVEIKGASYVNVGRSLPTHLL